MGFTGVGSILDKTADIALPKMLPLLSAASLFEVEIYLITHWQLKAVLFINWLQKISLVNLLQFNDLSVLVTGADVFIPSFVCDRLVELGANDYCVIFKIQEGSQYLN